MTYTIYKSTDPDAPQLSNAAGSLKTVLKACLVTGYGTGTDTKAGAGWNLLYDEPNKAVFQPVDTDGENLMLRVDDTPATYYTLFSAYSTMSDINTGTQVFNGGKVTKNNGAWFIVATAKWFWYVITTSDDTVAAPFFYGNLPRLIPEKQNATVLVHHTWQDSDVGRSKKSRGIMNPSGSPFVLSSKGVCRCFTAFNGTDYNLTSADIGELVWCDISVSANSGEVHGVLPVIKATPVNQGKPTWHAFHTDIYAIKVGLYGKPAKQLIMDFSNVT